MRVRDDVFAQSFSWTHHVQCCHRELQAQWPVGKSSPAVAGDIRNFFMMKRYEECINFIQFSFFCQIWNLMNLVFCESAWCGG